MEMGTPNGTKPSKFVLSCFTQILNLPIDDVSRIGDDIPIPKFDVNTLRKLISEAIDILSYQKILVPVKSPIAVIGDLHGSFQDLIRCFVKTGLPPHTKYLFLGDYVDRGNMSIEVVVLLTAFFCSYPDRITLLRGNHEFRTVNASYGFKAEIMNNYQDESLWEEFNRLFDYLPIVAIMDTNFFCVHAGISSCLKSFDQLCSIYKPILDDSDQLIQDLVWSDPTKESLLYGSNVGRGKGSTFGQMALQNFLINFNVKAVIRGHQCMKNGVSQIWDKHFITVFSSSSYSSPMGNKAGVIEVDQCRIKHHELEPIIRKNRDELCFYDVVGPDTLGVVNKSVNPIRAIQLPKLLSPGRSSSIQKNRRIPTNLIVCKNRTIQTPSDI